MCFEQRYIGTVREENSLNILLEFVPGGSIQSLLGRLGSFPEAVSTNCYVHPVFGSLVNHKRIVLIECIYLSGHQEIHETDFAWPGVFTSQWNHTQGHKGMKSIRIPNFVALNAFVAWVLNL